MTKLVEGLVLALDGADNVFNEVKDDPIYEAALDGINLAASPLMMSFGFVKSFDPWSGPTKVVMGALVDIFQTIVGKSYLFMHPLLYSNIDRPLQCNLRPYRFLPLWM